MRKAIVLALGALLAAGAVEAGKPASAWLRGNTHTHTTDSDGDAPVQQVVNWYHDQGYNFLLITDHNRTSWPQKADLNDKRSDFVLIPANEITERYVHLTAAGITDPLTPASMRKAFEANGTYGEGVTDQAKANPGIVTLFGNGIVATGGIAFINHPNFVDGVQAADIIPAKNVTHIEVFNGHPACYNWGNDRHVSVGAKWDEILSAGRLVYGVAADDAHNYIKTGRRYACPGRGWIMVDAPSVDAQSILDAIAEGRFYASSGVMLDRCVYGQNKINVRIDQEATQRELGKGFLFANITDEGQEGYTIEAIGQNGKTLAKTEGTALSYRLKPGDGYVRLLVTYCHRNDDGTYYSYYAWTQPVMEKK